MGKFTSFNSLSIFLSFCLILTSCSKDEEGGSKTNSLNSIEITADVEDQTLELGETVTFTVKGDDGANYTQSSTIFVNDQPIEGNTYSFNSSGEFDVSATLRSMESNSLVFEVPAHGMQKPSALELVADIEGNTANPNQKVTFQVLGGNGLDYTAVAEITVNGEPIEGNSFTFTEGGNYSFTATYDNVETNIIEFEVTSENYVSLNRQKALRNQEIIFEHFTADGTNVTTGSTFYVNGAAISGNTFSSSEEGGFEVYATTADGNQTEAVAFQVFVPERNIVFEDFTGTWCGWCPRVTSAINMLEAKTENIVVVAHHLADEMEIPAAKQLAQHFEITEVPHARVNRTSAVPFPENDPAEIQRIAAMAGTEAETSIAIDTELAGDLLDVRVKIMSEVALNNYKIVVYLLQDNIIYPQENYLNSDSSSEWYGMGDPIEDFVHDDVLEVELTDILGDPLQAVGALEEVTIDFNPVDLSQYAYNTYSNYYNPSNFEVAVYLLNEDGTAVNAQKVTAGQNANYE